MLPNAQISRSQTPMLKQEYSKGRAEKEDGALTSKGWEANISVCTRPFERQQIMRAGGMKSYRLAVSKAQSMPPIPTLH